MNGNVGAKVRALIEWESRTVEQFKGELEIDLSKTAFYQDVGELVDLSKGEVYDEYLHFALGGIEGEAEDTDVVRVIKSIKLIDTSRRPK